MVVKSSFSQFTSYVQLSCRIRFTLVPFPHPIALHQLPTFWLPPSLTRLHFPNLLAHNFSLNHVPP
jgi:hypothetical protein